MNRGSSGIKATQRVGSATEEEIYQALGLAWVPPKVREDRGEIPGGREPRAAPFNRCGCIFAAICIRTVRNGWPRQRRRAWRTAARAAGLDYMAVTDHSQSLAMANGLDEARALAQPRGFAPSTARRHPSARRHRVRYPARRHDGSRG